MDVDVVTIDTSTATATLQAALVSNTAAGKGLDKTDDTVDDATDGSAGAGVNTKNKNALTTCSSWMRQQQSPKHTKSITQRPRSIVQSPTTLDIGLCS